MPDPAALLRLWLLVLVAERAIELRRSGRNFRAALAAGGVESGRGHYPAIVALHAAFLLGCAAEPILAPRPWPAPAAWAALAVALLAQGLRWWAVLTLGPRWSTRVVVVPGAPRIAAGPYRFLRHPNYLAVRLELAAVPLIGGAVFTAVVATVLNAVLLRIRIRSEERALGWSGPAPVAAGRRPLPGGSP